MHKTIEGMITEPGSKKPDPICSISNLSHSYGGLTAVDISHLEIQRGLITAIIGPNGAGKTTLFNTITGFEKPKEGTWFLNDLPLSKALPHQIAQAKMVRTFQLTRTLDNLTVMQSMLLASNLQNGEKLRYALFSKWRHQEAQDIKRAENLLEIFNLSAMKNDHCSTLSGGQRKLLEISRVLMCEPELILLDEPLAGVNPALIEEILHYLRYLQSTGITVVFIEHNIDAVLDVSDWVVCLAQGQVISECPPDELIQNQAVIEAYLGKQSYEK